MAWFHPPPPTVWGPDAVTELPAILSRLDATSALVVADPGVVDAGLAREVSEELPFEPRVFDGVEPNPSRETVDRLAAAYDGEAVVIAVGGGSVIDAAKAATALPAVATADEPPLDALRDWPVLDPVPNPDAAVPLLLVPTTAGTGSETGHWAVISDHDREEKLSVGHRVLAAEAAVLDPSLTTTLPPGLTASSGFDVIAHALEALVAESRLPMTRPLAEHAYRQAADALPVAVEAGDDLEVRSTMLASSYLAGVAMNNAGLGAVHGISHAIGGLYDTPHGHTNALLLPPVIRRNADRSAAARSIYATVSGDDTPGTALADHLEALRETVGLGRDLPGLPDRPDWDRVADRAVANVNMATNPVEYTTADVVEVCKAAFE